MGLLQKGQNCTYYTKEIIKCSDCNKKKASLYDVEGNLQTLCFRCNRGKSNK